MYRACWWPTRRSEPQRAGRSAKYRRILLSPDRAEEAGSAGLLRMPGLAGSTRYEADRSVIAERRALFASSEYSFYTHRFRAHHVVSDVKVLEPNPPYGTKTDLV